MANNPNAVKNLRPFKPGDPRINRGGRPKSFDALRKEVQKILNEEFAYDETSERTLSRLHAMIRGMSSGRNPGDHKTLLEYGYGKVKDEINLGGEVKLTWKDFIETDRDDITGTDSE